IRDRNVTGVQTCALPILQNSDEITDNRKLISSELSNLVKNELKDTEKEEIINKLEKTTPSLSEEEVKKVVLAEILKDYSDKQNSQPKATFRDRKSTRLNSSHVSISYAVFCLKKKNKKYRRECSNE